MMALGAQIANGGKAAAPVMLPGVAPAPAPPALLPPPARRHSRRNRHRRHRSDSRRSRNPRRGGRSRSRGRGRSHSRRSGREGRSGRSCRRDASSSYSYDDEDDGDVGTASERLFTGVFWHGTALPRECRRLCRLPPLIIYEILHTLLPKKFTITELSTHPEYRTSAHRDSLLPIVCHLTGQPASNPIPHALRRQPKLFFQGIEQLKARAAKIFKETPGLGGPGATAEAAAAAAKAGGAAPALENSAADPEGEDTSDLVAKAVVAAVIR